MSQPVYIVKVGFEGTLLTSWGLRRLVYAWLMLQNVVWLRQLGTSLAIRRVLLVTKCLKPFNLGTCQRLLQILHYMVIYPYMRINCP